MERGSLLACGMPGILLALGSPAPRGKGPSWGAERRDCSLGWGLAPPHPSLAHEAGDEGLPCPVPPCLGRRWEPCAHAKVGGFLVRYQLLIGPSARLCNGGGSLPRGASLLAVPAWHRAGSPSFWVGAQCKCLVGCPGGMWHLWWNRGIQARSSTTAWVRACREGPGRVQVPALGKGTGWGEHFTMQPPPAVNHRAPLAPQLPPALPGPPITACTCLCSGATSAQGWGPEAGGVGGGGGWVLAGASLNLASVECHLTQTVCASLSPYQPFCSSHLRGGSRECFGEEERSLPAPRSLASLFPLCLPLGCETPSYKLWCRRSPMLLQPPGKRGGWGGESSAGSSRHPGLHHLALLCLSFPSLQRRG